ncbi:MAG: hypothetical protein ACKVOM_07200 [Ferruginibacter sp.]
MNDFKQTVLDIEKERTILINEMSNWFDKIKSHTENVPLDLNSQIKLLETIRKDLYENINQIQHSALIIKAAEELKIKYPSVDSWTWHPKQTSHPDFADLTGYVKNEVFINVEVTTSLKPVGTIDQRMISTLTKLNSKSGFKFYYVLTKEMALRAKTKIKNNNFDIEIREIS